MCATLLALCLAGINLYEMASFKGLHNLGVDDEFLI